MGFNSLIKTNVFGEDASFLQFKGSALYNLQLSAIFIKPLLFKGQDRYN